jgi:hypothetical protein
MTDKELKELVASLAVSQKKTDEQMRRTNKKLQELGEQIGGLGEKFGGFTEGMAFPSMEKILRERFKMDVISVNVKSQKNGRLMELDVLAYSNSDSNEVYIVEIKSHLRQKELDQIEKTLDQFFDFFPSFKGKKLFGILAVVDAPENLREEVIKRGIYLARIHDNLFELQVPETFTPRAF